ncbi:EthD domain-containing protein [Sphingomonas radiodurans]|uniref:EthD domain-containing protein n=1 Tax=Sphingomonas radiodurans TaxID=2890321 RepID=UPI001E43CBDB|nr:EthD domain-containing protein [Sphingomonas radiodurans]WBH15008.1 EthD domain-containing protein [Sphingomonas radiodurans]
MIKLVFCLRRRPDMSREAFQAYWRDHHAPLVAQVAPLLRIRQYVQSHSFDDPRLAAAPDVRGAIVAPYDGVAELHWDTIEDVTVAGGTKEGRDAGRRLLEDERKFIDLPNSPLFWVREHHVI